MDGPLFIQQLMGSHKRYPHPLQAIRESLHTTATDNAEEEDKDDVRMSSDEELGTVMPTPQNDVMQHVDAIDSSKGSTSAAATSTDSGQTSQSASAAALEKEHERMLDKQWRDELHQMFLADADIWAAVDL